MGHDAKEKVIVKIRSRFFGPSSFRGVSLVSSKLASVCADVSCDADGDVKCCAQSHSVIKHTIDVKFILDN